jgi:hypothetical protein
MGAATVTLTPGTSTARSKATSDRSALAPEVLVALADVLFAGHTAFDPIIDRLRPANRQEPKPLGIRPDPAAQGDADVLWQLLPVVCRDAEAGQASGVPR